MEKSWMNLQFVDIEEAHKAHEAIVARASTKASVRDFALLHSAIERPKATYTGKRLYPTIWAMAAALLESLCLNHPFTDGNKRTAWTLTHRFLWLNGWHLRSHRMEAADFMVYVDNAKPTVAQIASWLKSHSTARD